MTGMTRTVRFGIIGAGLMGREFASAAARWVHLADIGVRPEVAVVCDANEDVLRWYERLSPRPRLVTDYRDVLADESVEAVYCAVPHHLHEELYTQTIRAGKHLFGEKPFGIDLAANLAISRVAREHPGVFVRCSSEMPFFPGGQHVARWIEEARYGRIIEVRAAFLHSSDLDPTKKINWKRQARYNGASGSMGDLGMHVLHLPLRAGWMPANVRAVLSDIFHSRPNPAGDLVACDTPENAVLLCEVPAPDGSDQDYTFPMHLATKRVAPGEANTWTIEIDGTLGSIAFSTKTPKTLRRLDYTPGGTQPWAHLDLGAESAYPTITGAIFEFGFSDAILQMWAAFMDELAHGDEMRGPFRCATIEEATASHRLFAAAMTSHQERRVVELAEVAGPG
jgi:predicted dehydrogenase